MVQLDYRTVQFDMKAGNRMKKKSCYAIQSSLTEEKGQSLIIVINYICQQFGYDNIKMK